MPYKYMPVLMCWSWLMYIPYNTDTYDISCIFYMIHPTLSVLIVESADTNSEFLNLSTNHVELLKWEH